MDEAVAAPSWGLMHDASLAASGVDGATGGSAAAVVVVDTVLMLMGDGVYDVVVVLP